MKNSLRNLIIFALLWQFTVYLNLFNGKLPSLIEVKNALIDYNVLVEICLSLLITLKFVLASLTIGTILGYSIGTFIGLTPKIKSIIYPFLNAIKTLPITILLPLFLSVFGYENYPKQNFYCQIFVNVKIQLLASYFKVGNIGRLIFVIKNCSNFYFGITNRFRVFFNASKRYRLLHKTCI